MGFPATDTVGDDKEVLLGDPGVFTSLVALLEMWDI